MLSCLILVYIKHDYTVLSGIFNVSGQGHPERIFCSDKLWNVWVSIHFISQIQILIIECGTYTHMPAGPQTHTHTHTHSMSVKNKVVTNKVCLFLLAILV